MLQHRRAYALCAQATVALPLAGQPLARADSFDLFAARRLEDGLPVQAKAVAIVAHIHDLLAHEQLSDFWSDQVKDFAAVNDGRLAARVGGPHTAEEDLRGPALI